MGAADILQPFLIILGVVAAVAAVAAVYFVVTAIKGRASRDGGGKHRAA